MEFQLYKHAVVNPKKISSTISPKELLELPFGLTLGVKEMAGFHQELKEKVKFFRKERVERELASNFGLVSGLSHGIGGIGI